MNCRYNNALIIDERITRLFLFLTIFAFLPFYRSLFLYFPSFISLTRIVKMLILFNEQIDRGI